MSQPDVILTELDGALGILPSSQGRLFAIVGVSDSGPMDTPATFARTTDIVASFGGGPLVEAAAYYIEKYGRPVVLVRTGETTAGSFPATTVTVQTGTATVVATVDQTTFPNDDYECHLAIVTGGTIGVDGITLRYSLDGGRTTSGTIALGVATDYVIPGSGGIKVEFAAGDFVAGDTVAFIAEAPKWNTTEVGTALDALFASAVSWEMCRVVGAIEAADVAVIDPKFTGAIASGKYRSWYGSVRMPDAGETEAAYLGALTTEFASTATVHGSLCAGAAKISSGVSGRLYRRGIAQAVAAMDQAQSEEINIADVNLGTIPGVLIRDSNGNPDEHDESINPGLDDARFTVLRTWDGFAGVYVNRPRMFSTEGSDFDLHTKRRVMNLTHDALRRYFVRRLNKPIRVDKDSGFILKEEALEIEAGARQAMSDVVLSKPKASAVEFVLSRTDNILSTKTLRGSARVIPLAYPEFIEIEVGFLNPALQVQTV